MFGKDKKETKAVKLIRKDVECCQCWKKISTAYIKPEEEENFKDGYIMCPECFSDLAVRNKKEN